MIKRRSIISSLMNSNNVDNVNEFKNNMIIINSYSDMHKKDELDNDIAKNKVIYQDILNKPQKLD